MDDIIKEIEAMRARCGWDRSDTVASMIKSVAVESGELLETIQWDDQAPRRDKVAGELADVLMYALTLCRLLGLDPHTIITEKIKDVESRYPEVTHD